MRNGWRAVSLQYGAVARIHALAAAVGLVLRAASVRGRTPTRQPLAGLGGHRLAVQVGSVGLGPGAATTVGLAGLSAWMGQAWDVYGDDTGRGGSPMKAGRPGMQWSAFGRAGDPVCRIGPIAPERCSGYHQRLSGLPDWPIFMNGAPSRDRLPGRATSSQVVVTPREAGLAATPPALLLPESSMTGVVPDRGPAGPLLFPEAGSPAPLLRIKAERERQGN